MSAPKASRRVATGDGARPGSGRAVVKPGAARPNKAARSVSASKTSGGRAASTAKATGAKVSDVKSPATKASRAKAATSKTAGQKPASKAVSKSASKPGSASARSASRAKASSARKGAPAAKPAASTATSSQGRPSGGFVKHGVRAFTRSYLVRFTTVLAAVVVVAFVAASAFSAQSNEHPTQRADGLPVYITDEMIDTARAMRHEYGHPVGCTIAQIIQESGRGTMLSMLAERDNNLFGMKWVESFSGKHGVVGPVQWNTNEEYDGETVSVNDAFIKFESKKACIEFRSSVFLQSSTYADNPTIIRAIETNNSALMAWGLQDAGWATDSSYAEHLVSIMDTYDLYRFDAI